MPCLSTVQGIPSWSNKVGVCSPVFSSIEHEVQGCSLLLIATFTTHKTFPEGKQRKKARAAKSYISQETDMVSLREPFFSVSLRETFIERHGMQYDQNHCLLSSRLDSCCKSLPTRMISALTREVCTLCLISSSS